MPRFQDQEVVDIGLGASALRFAPQAGGRLLSWHIEGRPVIHWPEVADWRNPAGIRGGNPLLFPFLGRHRVAGEIGKWRDAQGVVRAVPMHGFARDLPFSCEVDAQGAGLRMILTDSPATRAGYPFGFRFEAAYRLADARTLDVELITANTGDAPLPYYAGHHFYFTLPHAQRGESTVELPASVMRYHRPDGAISAPLPGAGRYRFDEARIHDCIHCLASGSPEQPVRIVMPGLGREIEIALNRPGSVPWYCVTTWTERPDSDFYCVEPWLALPDAIHHGMGLRWLAPGQTEAAALRIRVADRQAG